MYVTVFFFRLLSLVFLQELEVPHFHHEFVYETIVMVIEQSTRRAAETMAKLLESLCKSCIVSADQLKLGSKRVFDNMGDIVLGNVYRYAI